ncbi:MAG: Gfo/Idh/MocA family oxidoreductase [Candidatus Omnitrophota bacterium]
MADKTVTWNVGIIGLGVGWEHIQGFQAHPSCRVTALCDFDADKLQKARSAFPGMRLTSEAKDILTDKDIHVVSIASYDNYHHEQILLALKNGKHVFAEKPLCLSEKECQDIADCLKARPALKLSSNLILRKCPRFVWLRKKIRDNEMGELYQLEGDYNYGRIEKVTQGWRGKIDFYSAVYGGGVHIIDLLMWLSGRNITDVYAYGNKISSQGSQFKYHDLVTCVFRFDSGATGKMTVNFGCVCPHFHPLAIYGTRAAFFNAFREYGLWSVSRDPSVEPQKVLEEYPGARKGDLLFNFMEAVTKDVPLEVTTEDVFKAMAVCFAIERSAHTGRAEQVNYFK